MTSLFKKPSKDNLLDEVNIEFSDYESSSSSSVSTNSSPNLISHNSSGNQNKNGNFKPESLNSLTDLFIYIFGVDLRSLAAMRIGLSILIILDLYVRSLYLYDHYTDAGTLPVSSVIDINPFYWSLYFITANYYITVALFIMNACFAFCFLIGYRTTLANVLCWIFMTSLHVRNPYVLNGGDDFFRLFVFWAMFLPCGAKFSIDSLLNLEYTNKKNNTLNPKSVTYNPISSSNQYIPTTDSEGKYLLSFASVAIQVQFALVYIITAALKTGKEWNVEYSSVWYALHLDQFATPLGIWLRQFVSLGQFLTWFTIVFEWIGPLFFCIPFRKLHGPIRTIGVIGFWCMHFGFGSCMELGFFMYIPGMCSLVFLPSWFWDKIFDYLYSNSKSQYRTTSLIYINSNNESLYKTISIYKQFFLLHSTPILMVQRHDEENLLNGGGINTANGTTGGVNSIYNEFKERNCWIAVENSITNERVYSYDAFITLINLSPILQYLNLIFNTNLFRRFYSFLNSNKLFNNQKLNPILKVSNKIYPKQTITCSRKYWLETFCFLMLIYVINWNLAGLYGYRVPEPIRWVAQSLKVEQHWSMFSPYPSKDNGWMVYPGELSDGTFIDIFTGQNITYEKPALISSTFPTQRWRKYLMNLQGSGFKEKRLLYGRYLCREWNWFGRHPENQLKSFKLIFMWQLTPTFPTEKNPNPTALPPEPIELWSHYC
ncbi:hypothetical protein DICPUDRAFT_41586 [Dictyostelium purpureum]|uniref:HTTM-like domain-containing protein n=1 Tax=Dictyostelium purpureum TaxID=5786 RepID=F1A0E4_DICPU|nr:uncharacterized protein DICPUDRAFT_41586 [Dictyostelium purpureum]EGC30337.1 hypothetical protein DICPUDRAFT_41586 [Dictyostelium purpureum]|eukprot:XP_003293134.1 hypothetical protein DICPUDRAFT_41586 [Dictyostelium purpureum]